MYYRKGEKEEDERKGKRGGVDERKEGGFFFMLNAPQPQLMISNKYNGQKCIGLDKKKI